MQIELSCNKKYDFGFPESGECSSLHLKDI